MSCIDFVAMHKPLAKHDVDVALERMDMMCIIKSSICIASTDRGCCHACCSHMRPDAIQLLD